MSNCDGFCTEARVLRQMLFEFSTRLDFSLHKGIPLLDIRKELDELSGDVREVIHSDGKFSPYDNQRECPEIFELRRALSESRARCNELLRENLSFKVIPHDHEGAWSPGSTRAETEPDESSWIRERIKRLKCSLVERNSKIEELRGSHEAELRKTQLAHQKEVKSLRDALESTSRILERWKNIYSEDVSRLKEALNWKSSENKQRSTLFKSKSSERLTYPCTN